MSLYKLEKNGGDATHQASCIPRTLTWQGVTCKIGLESRHPHGVVVVVDVDADVDNPEDADVVEVAVVAIHLISHNNSSRIQVLVMLHEWSKISNGMAKCKAKLAGLIGNATRTFANKRKLIKQLHALLMVDNRPSTILLLPLETSVATQSCLSGLNSRKAPQIYPLRLMKRLGIKKWKMTETCRRQESVHIIPEKMMGMILTQMTIMPI